MSKRILSTVAMLLLLGCASGCAVNEHTVGDGSTGLGETRERQFYFLFGLFRLNEVDSEAMAENSTSYRIRSAYEFTDILLSIVLAPLTVSTRSVEVTR
ncbi:MAG: hypothetical protein AAF196_15760 [Planctomycetota bacterium]